MADSILSWRTTASVAWADGRGATDDTPISTDPVHPDSSILQIEIMYALRRPELIRFLIRFGVDATEAEDIAQESFLRAFREAKQNKHPDNLLGWVTTCAKNLAIDRWHRGQREMLVPARLWEMWKKTLPTPDSTPGKSYTMERRLWLIEALTSLDVTEQQCMVLRSEGATFREIATALNVPLRHAVYLTGKAVQKLRSSLQDISS